MTRPLIALALAITACGPAPAVRATIATANPIREWCIAAETMRKGQRVTGELCLSTAEACSHAYRMATSWVGSRARLRGVTKCVERVR